MKRAQNSWSVVNNTVWVSVAYINRWRCQITFIRKRYCVTSMSDIVQKVYFLHSTGTCTSYASYDYVCLPHCCVCVCVCAPCRCKSGCLKIRFDLSVENNNSVLSLSLFSLFFPLTLRPFSDFCFFLCIEKHFSVFPPSLKHSSSPTCVNIHIQRGKSIISQKWFSLLGLGIFLQDYFIVFHY